MSREIAVLVPELLGNAHKVVFAWKRKHPPSETLLHGKRGLRRSDPMDVKHQDIYLDGQMPLSWHRQWRITAVALLPT